MKVWKKVKGRKKETERGRNKGRKKKGKRKRKKEERMKERMKERKRKRKKEKWKPSLIFPLYSEAEGTFFKFILLWYTTPQLYFYLPPLLPISPLNLLFPPYPLLLCFPSEKSRPPRDISQIYHNNMQ